MLVQGGNDVTDTATFTEGTSDGTGLVTFRLYKQMGNTCKGTLVGTKSVAVTNGLDHDVDASRGVYSATFHVMLAGQYHFTVDFDNQGDASNKSISEVPCGMLNGIQGNLENPEVPPPPTHPDTGQKITIKETVSINGYVTGACGADASCSKATFSLFKDTDRATAEAACKNGSTSAANRIDLNGAAPGLDLTQPIPDATGVADTGDISIPFENGTTHYFWTVTFTGNDNNQGSTSLCEESFSIAGNHLPSTVNP